MGSQTRINIRSGDSLWKIALQNLGRGSRWHELIEANPWIANPNQIRAGAQLILPVTVASSVSTHEAGHDATSTMTIHAGDTLWSLARSHFGHGALWTCIAGANPRIADANLIFAGQLLVIPGGCGP
ncbi:MAG: LysM peptidoglycan-binding domain-containing protein [Candidatus Acidiferrum sp.]